jgi:uncharacterized protein with HEPN domain
VSRTDADYLVHIRDSIERIVRWAAPGRDIVLADEVLFEAILRRLETLSEAASHLSDPLKRRHPEIPWRLIIDFRNRLAHDYLDVRPERVWDVIVVDLPLLMAVVREEIGGSSGGGEPVGRPPEHSS